MKDDCRRALKLLETEDDPIRFRLFWVAGIALLRAVGHVLQKVDGKQDPALAAKIRSAYDGWKRFPEDHAIFWEFIEQERNQILKEYEIGFLAGPIDLLVETEHASPGEKLFCPLADGEFMGEDCRDVMGLAIRWWDKQLKAIQSE